jgi:hypothetical protein
VDSVIVFEFLRGIATPGIDKVMKVITDLGSTAFYMAVIPILYRCIKIRPLWSGHDGRKPPWPVFMQRELMEELTWR